MDLQVGVKVVLRSPEGKTLLLERAGELQGMWDIPGGRIDTGSPLMGNLEREVREETQLSIIGAPQLIAAQDILLNDKHVVRLTYVAQADGDPVLSPEEHASFRWVTFEELQAEAGLDRYLRQLLNEGILSEASWR